MAINTIALLPTIISVMAEVINIDYSKQPPRDLQLSAGASMAVAGFIVTFLVLGIFTILIKIVAIIGERMEARKASVPAITTTPTKPVVSSTTLPSMEIDIVAAAVAVANMYLKTKKAVSRGGAVDAWVLGERVAPPGSSIMDELTLRETTRWRRNE